jgi:hypothetical protein
VPFHSFRGQRSAAAVQGGEKFSQATNRTHITTYDQFDRKYVVPCEKRTGMPCGLYQPQFWAPWHPDFHPDYWIINPENTSELYIDLQRIIKDRMTAMREYHQRVIRWCNREQRPSPKLGVYDDLIVEHCGVPPRAYQLAVALLQSNPWVLGKTMTPDPRLVQYLEQPSREIEEEIDSYDFGADSYESTISRLGIPRRAPKPAPQRFANFADLKKAAPDLSDVDVNDIEAVSRAFGVADTTDDEAQSIAEHGEDLSDIDRLVEIEDDDDDAPGPDASEPTDSEGAEASGASDDDELLDHEEAADPDALGGRVVNPRNTEREEKRRPRRAPPPAGAMAPPDGSLPKAGRAFNRNRGRSLADGGTPVVSGG